MFRLQGFRGFRRLRVEGFRGVRFLWISLFHGLGFKGFVGCTFRI